MAELIRETELFGTDIPRLESLREKGRAAFRLPTPKTEAWKYTRLHVLKNGDFVPPASKFLAELSGEDGDGCGCSGCGGGCAGCGGGENVISWHRDTCPPAFCIQWDEVMAWN